MVWCGVFDLNTLYQKLKWNLQTIIFSGAITIIMIWLWEGKMKRTAVKIKNSPFYVAYNIIVKVFIFLHWFWNKLINTYKFLSVL